MFKNKEELLAMTIGGVALVVFLIVTFLITLIRFRRRVAKETEEKRIMTQHYEQELLRSKLETQEETFRHIARELHDNVGQLLSTTKMLLGITELKLAVIPQTLTTANATLGKAIAELRQLSRSLDREWLEQFKFIENLQQVIERINETETIQASISGNSNFKMSSEKQIILFRIVQEAIHNAVRHAAPTKLEVAIEVVEGRLIVQISNNGSPLPSGFTGMGTRNMRQRAILCQGSINWVSLVGQTLVTVDLPLNTNHEN